jgi:hypothetical protein
MKAITLWQPWAQLIFFQLNSFYAKTITVKRIETRNWKTPYRGELAIHAAKFKPLDKEIYNKIRSNIRGYATKESDTELELVKERIITQLYYIENGIPENRFGSVLGTATLIDCIPIEQLYGTEYDTPLERACGDWSPGRYGWILSDPILFSTPIEARGNQGFWNWERDE